MESRFIFPVGEDLLASLNECQCVFSCASLTLAVLKPEAEENEILTSSQDGPLDLACFV